MRKPIRFTRSQPRCFPSSTRGRTLGATLLVLARNYHVRIGEKNMIRISITLALVVIATAVPVAQAEQYGPLDPPIAAAIQTHRLDYGPLDPPIATAIRMHGTAAQPQSVAVPVDVAGFDWGDFAVGAGAVLALVLTVASLRAIFVVRSRRSEGLSA